MNSNEAGIAQVWVSCGLLSLALAVLCHGHPDGSVYAKPGGRLGFGGIFSIGHVQQLTTIAKMQDARGATIASHSSSPTISVASADASVSTIPSLKPVFCELTMCRRTRLMTSRRP